MQSQIIITRSFQAESKFGNCDKLNCTVRKAEGTCTVLEVFQKQVIVFILSLSFPRNSGVVKKY